MYYPSSPFSPSVALGTLLTRNWFANECCICNLLKGCTMLYYPWEVSFVMHHYHTTLMKNCTCIYEDCPVKKGVGQIRRKKKRAETLFSITLALS